MSTLLDIFGDDLGGGYNISCKLEKILNQSKLGPQVHELRFQALVGSFHGHAHHWICQLSNLTKGTFLVNNYWQALEILVGEDALWKTMEDQGIMGTKVFHEWLKEEHAYLSSLSKEPIQKMLEMEYYQKLVNRHAANEKLAKLKNCWQDVQEQAWAKLAARLAMDHYFKMEHACKEIEQLNIEIEQVATHMRDEESFLSAKEADMKDKNPAFAFQI
ncbi:hypothetical protein C0993_007718 [Termitomyces sp. T159_Od127]|nr:hypothetical protein C0993_007718 [Termitomyces sp. T159_Od127]